MAATNVKILFSPLNKLKEIGEKLSTKTTEATTERIPSTESSPPPEECQDSGEWVELCSFFASHGACQDPEYEPGMRTYCSKACQFC